MEATQLAASPHEVAGIRPPRAARGPVLSLPGVLVSLGRDCRVQRSIKETTWLVHCAWVFGALIAHCGGTVV